MLAFLRGMCKPFAILAMVVCLVPFSFAQGSFPDVPANHPNAEAILAVQSKGIVNGYPDGTFRPDQAINRAEFAKIIVGSKFEVSSEYPVYLCDVHLDYTDVSKQAWYSAYLCLATQHGIVGGYPDGTFKPGNTINFAEAAKIIAIADMFEGGLKAEGRNLPPDDGGEWYARYVAYLWDRGAIPPSINRIDQFITRGEMAEMVYRLLIASAQPSCGNNICEAGEMNGNMPTFCLDDCGEELLRCTEATDAVMDVFEGARGPCETDSDCALWTENQNSSQRWACRAYNKENLPRLSEAVDRVRAMGCRPSGDVMMYCGDSIAYCVENTCMMPWEAQNSARPPNEPSSGTFVEGQTRFAFSLYNTVSGLPGFSGKNVFLSPYSISTALSMCAAGAAGETAAEMWSALGIDPATAGTDARDLIDHLSAYNDLEGIALHTANSLWVERTYPAKESYVALVRDFYRSVLESADFAHAPEEGRLRIVRWIEEKTNGKIKEMPPPGSIDVDTVLVIANAIYFNGDWKQQFEKERTSGGTFTRLDGKSVEVPMMHGTEYFGYAEDALVQILEMPYKGDALSMVVLLPRAGNGVADIENRLSLNQWRSWVGQIKTKEVMVSFPKFRVTSFVNLNTVLQSLGIVKAFDPGSADFSGMTQRSPSDLSISDVLHKAFVDVSERGTEAAASTIISMRTTAVSMPEVFNADHPFLYFIRDKKTGSVLFMGKIEDPLM